MDRLLVVSPHRDDAAFSCALAIREFGKKHEVVVANFFTVSQYAPFAPGGSDITELRRREDERFAAYCRVELNDLSLVDAPQRLSIGMGDISTTRDLDRFDDESKYAIWRHIHSLSPGFLLAPLAIGDHIDHRIAQAAVREISEVPLGFYEDLPYTARAAEDAAERRAQALGLALVPFVIQVPDAQDYKAHCAAFYPSQIDSETVREIACFASRHGGGERFWLTPAAMEFVRTAGMR